MKKLFLAVLYITFAALLTAVLLVVRFPKDSFLSYITSRLEEHMPGYACSISDFGYHYPASVKLGTVTFQKRESGREWVLENMNLIFDPKEFLQDFLAQFQMYDGSVSLEGKLKNGLNDVYFNGIEVSGIDLRKANLRDYFQRNVSGILGFSGSYGGSLSGFAEGSLNGKVEVTDFVSDLKRPVLTSNEVRFERISAQVEVGHEQLNFSDGTATGPMYDGTFSGRVTFAQKPSGGSIVINGTLSPKQTFIRKNRQAARASALLYKKYRNTKIPFNVTGRLQEPVFRFGSRPQQANN